MTIWESVQRLEGLGVKISGLMDRLMAENEELSRYLEEFHDIEGDTTNFSVAAEWVGASIEANDETRARVDRFLRFVERRVDEIRKVGS